MIAIPNMDKPKRCRGCFAEYDTLFCKILGEKIPDKGVRSDCQLIEINQEDEEAVLYLARMRKAMREGKSLREFLDGERRSDGSI